MKSLLPWFYLIAVAGSQPLYAIVEAKQPEECMVDYRQGEYFRVAQTLTKQDKEQQNNPLLNYYLGRMRLYGYGMLKNNDLALRYFTQAGQQGLLTAQQWLAKYYLHINKPDLAFNWFKKAADQDYLPAKMYVAAAYLFGYGVQKNPDVARRYYIDAAQNGNALAQYTLGMNFLNSRYSSDRKMGIIWLNKAAEQGSVPAQTALGKLFAEEKSSLYDPKRALLWIKKAALSQNVEAQLALADFYQAGKIVPADEKLAKEWQEKAKANQALQSKHSDKVENRMAAWLSDDQTEDFTHTVYNLGGICTAWNNQAALQENNYNPSPKMHRTTRQALYKPAFVLASPKEIPINEYFDFLAPLFSGQDIGSWYFPLYPIDKQIQALLDSQSPILAPASWQSAVDDGRTYPAYPKPAMNYVDELTAGWQIKANFQQVLTYLYYRAILGDADAQFKLGQLYEYGIVVAKNIEQAIIYYELAALQQDVRAEYNLGVLYLEGKTTPINYQKGIDWLMDAAFKGNAYAQYALANIYEHGLVNQDGVSVVSQNHQQAIALFYLASANHFAQAQYRLAEYLTHENNDVLSVDARHNRTKLVNRLFQAAAKSGVAEAILPAAFYEAMDQDPAKQKQAFVVAQEQARAGNSLAALLLGLLYERGIGVSANQADAIYWYQNASSNPVSQFMLGTYLIEGHGVSRDPDKGRNLLQQSADAGFSYANYNLAIVNKAQGLPFLTELDHARQLGNSKAGLLLADYYLLQANNPGKMQEARDIYQHFADKGDRNAQLKLAFLYDRGLGGPVNLELAAHWYTLSAKQGQPLAQYLLGLMYQLGKIGVAPDYEQAKKWYDLAKSNYSPAAVALGFVFDTVDDNYSEAWASYQLAANHRDPIGQYNLGLIYEEGKGQPVDQLKAQALYQSAADQGFSPAMTRLAGLYFKGIHGERDEQKALFWYQKAAALGYAEANYQLGLFSETGVGLPLNVENAVKFYQHAAGLGDEKAILALARMYQYGLGVPKDLAHAAELYRSLATGNNAYAQYQLAVFYYDGSLGQRLPDEGKRLLTLASHNGSIQANNRLLRMNAELGQELSFIEPIVVINNLRNIEGQPADLMYLDALSEWNRGDELVSRTILNRLVNQFPHFTPAQWVIEQS